MAIDGWERFVEIEALMQPGGTELDPLERAARHGPAVPLALEGDDAGTPEQLRACDYCGTLFVPRQARARYCRRMCGTDHRHGRPRGGTAVRA